MNRPEGEKKNIVRFTTAYKNSRIKRLGRIIHMEKDNPVRTSTLQMYIPKSHEDNTTGVASCGGRLL